MTKKEVISKCNDLYAQLEDLESIAENLLKNIKIIMRAAGYLPSELGDVSDGDSYE